LALMPSDQIELDAPETKGPESLSLSPSPVPIEPPRWPRWVNPEAISATRQSTSRLDDRDADEDDEPQVEKPPPKCVITGNGAAAMRFALATPETVRTALLEFPAGVHPANLCLARSVIRRAPELVPEVLAGRLGLSGAAERARKK